MIRLDAGFRDEQRRRVEQAILPAMEAIYKPGQVTFDPEYRPELKTIEKVVVFHDYQACGISVLARLAARGNTRAAELLDRVLATTVHYRTRVWNHDVPGWKTRWTTPLRRLIFHLALADSASGGDPRIRALVEDQVPAAITHCRGFLPGVRDLYLHGVNNHTAIFMQGIWHCGRVFGRPEWTELAREFAERYLASGHPDGYFEENTNREREGGPSLVYTPLTAGCLFDVLEGATRHREAFIRAGDFYRGFLDPRFRMLPIADERTNHDGPPLAYGLALHTLTARGRGFVTAHLAGVDYATWSPEELAVLHYELGLMVEGVCETPECLTSGVTRIGLPLGVIRKGGWTAALSALRALNRELGPDNDYALDQQTMVSLTHDTAGPVLLGVKAKNNPEYSTFRVGEDAYTVATGELETGPDHARATLRYRTFTATIRWDLAAAARLTLSVDTDALVTTALPVARAEKIRASAPFQVRELRAFSPYADGNTAPPVRALVAEWRRAITITIEP